jgi:hypothetical protein
MTSELNTGPGKLVEIGCNMFSASDYVWGVGYTYKLDPRYLNPNNTYISIFGPVNAAFLNVFENDSRIKIIYKAQKAVNRREGHGTDPRNTLVVWEFSPGTAQNAPA